MSDLQQIRARDIMSSPVRTVTRDASLDEAARVLRDAGISGVPVLDHHGAPVGVLSQFDIVTHVAGLDRGLDRAGSYYVRSALRWERGEDEDPNREEADILVETRVDDVMTPELIGVAPDAPLVDVLKQMSERRVHRLLVLDGNQLLGVVTSMDVLSALASRL